MDFPWHNYSVFCHLGIDGFSRLVTYLSCSSNNLAHTALQQFCEAVNTFSLPSRVRCDRGVENVDIARVMLVNRGVGRGSVITGSSVHNQASLERGKTSCDQAVSEHVLSRDTPTP